jgi:hypothetical protein
LLLLVDEPVTEKPETQEENDEARVKDEAEAEKAPKTKKVSKTVYDWELMNTANQFGHVNHQMLLKTNKPTSTKA